MRERERSRGRGREREVEGEGEGELVKIIIAQKPGPLSTKNRAPPRLKIPGLQKFEFSNRLVITEQGSLDTFIVESVQYDSGFKMIFMN